MGTVPPPRYEYRAPHPVMGCRCAEGAVVTPGTANVERWLPPVHDCAYIADRNRRLGLDKRRLAKQPGPTPSP